MNINKKNYLNIFFDKIYLINLDRRKDRFNNINIHLNKRNILYKKITAIDYKDLDIKCKKYHKRFTIKEDACLLSHLKIIKEAKELGYKKILILEDDILFHKELNKYVNTLDKIPKNWNLIYLGCGQRNGANDVFKKKPFYLANKSRGTYAYGVNENIYNYLIKILNKGFHGVHYPIDLLLNNIQSIKNSYVIYENLIIADVSDSDITKPKDMKEYSIINNWNLMKYDLIKYSKEELLDNKIVQSLWIGENLSLMEELCIKSFISNGHEFHLYTYDKINNIPNGCIIKDGNEILPKTDIFYYKKSSTLDGKSDMSVSAFSNLFRYKLLYEKGGYWVDMDMICLKYLNFKNDYVFSSEEDKYIIKSNKLYLNPHRNRQMINAGIIKCPVKSDFANYCYNKCLKKKQDKTLKWGSIGPRIVKLGVIKFKLKKYVKPYFYFCPINYRDVVDINLSNKIKIDSQWYCVHLWNECWKRNNMNKNILIKDSLYNNINQLIHKGYSYKYNNI
jgi:GR25 family glycosyltransferase involved in LPS biosynthesis